MGHTAFFVLLAAICGLAAVALRLLDGRAQRVAAINRPQADLD
jgi:hypothetical protein